MDPWSPYKELWVTVQEVIANKEYGAISHLENLLKQHKSQFTNLFVNPPKNPQHRQTIRKNYGIILDGDPNTHTFQEDFIEESIILSDLFNLNEYASLGLLLAGEQQLPNYPGLTRGLVAVLLYWDGRRCLVNSLKTLIQSRAGHSWTLDVSVEVSNIATNFTNDLLQNRIVDVILKSLSDIKVESIISSLSAQRGLGNSKHRRQIRDIVEEIRLSLSECIFNFAAQSNLSASNLTSVLNYLEVNSDSLSNDILDNVTTTLTFAAVYGFSMPVEVPVEPDDAGVDLLFNLPMLTDKSYVPTIYKLLTIGKEWKINGVKSFIQLALSLVLHSLAQVPNVISDLMKNNIYNDTLFADCIESDERILEWALDGKVFIFIKEYILRSEICLEEFFIRKLHNILTDFIYGMPMKIKEIRNNGDEVARILMLQAEPTQDLRKDFLNLIELITEMYKSDRNGLQLSTDFWPSSHYSASLLTPHSHQRTSKESDLNKFIRQSGDLLPPLLYVPYINMLASLSQNPSNAGYVFEMLRNNSAGDANLLCWDHFFASFHKYYATLKQEKQINVYGNPVPLQNVTYQKFNITPQEVDGLKAVLNLISSIADFDEHARIAMYENPKWNVGATFVGMLQCPIPSTLKAAIFQCLAKFSVMPEIACGIMIMLENCQILKSSAGTGCLINELEDVESKQEKYEMTQAFLDLLTILLTAGFNINLQDGGQNLNSSAYVDFAVESVFLKFMSRAYKNKWEKWQIGWQCLNFFNKVIEQYTPDPTHFQFTKQEDSQSNLNYSGFGGPNMATNSNKPLGYGLLIRAMSDENFFQTIQLIIESCIKYLDSYIKNPSMEEYVIKAGSSALNLIQNIFNVQDEFFGCMRSSGTSIVLNRIDKMLMSMNPMTRKADYITTIAKYVAHNMTCPKASLTAVEIIFWISKSSTASEQKIVDMLTNGCSRKMRDAILHGFVEALETNGPEVENDDTNSAESLHSKIRLTILRMMLFCVNLPQPNLAHFLLGFNLKNSSGSLQDPGVLGSPRTCLHSILMILSGGLDYSASVNTYSGSVSQNTPVLTELSFQLIYKLAANVDTSGVLLRYLRSSHDFVFRHICNLPFPIVAKSNVVMLQQAWLLKTAAIEMFLTTLNRQRSHTQRLVRLLFNKSYNLDQTDVQDTSMLNSTSFMNLSTQAVHNSTTGNVDVEQQLERSRVMEIISSVDFCEEMPDSLNLEQFVTLYIEETIKSYEVTDNFGLVYCDIKSLHNYLQVNVNSLRGADDINRRQLAMQEVEEILKVAMQRNQTRQSMHSKLTLITAWRHIIEIALTSCPNDLLTKDQRRSIIFELMNVVLKHALNQNATSELVAPLAPLFLTLITQLRSLLSATYDISTLNQSALVDIMQMQDFSLEAILNPEIADLSLSANMVAPLQAVIKGMLEWLLQSTTNSKVRTHLYASLLFYMQLCQKPKHFAAKSTEKRAGRLGFGFSSQSVYSKLANENTKLFQSFGDGLMELLCRDSCDGHSVCRILAYACLDAIVKIDWEQSWLQYMVKKGYISHIAHSIVNEEVAIQQTLLPQPKPLTSLYIYEQKMALLCSLALTLQGSKEMIDNGIFAKLSEVQFFDLRPTYSDNDNASFIPGMMARYRQVLFPALKLCANVLATLGMSHHYEANALILEFFLAHADVLISAVFRQRNALSDAQSLQELRLITRILSQVASQNFNDQAIYATVPQNVIMELQGHVTKIQRHLISLLPEYSVSHEEVMTIKKRMEDLGENHNDVVLLIHEIQSDLITYCRNMLDLTKSSDADSGILLFSLNMNVESNIRIYAESNRKTPGVGLLVQILKQSSEKYSAIKKESVQVKQKMDNIANLPLQDLKKIVNNESEKLTLSQRRVLCTLKLQADVKNNNLVLKSLYYTIENTLIILWHHLNIYILKLFPQSKQSKFFDSFNKSVSGKSHLRPLHGMSTSFHNRSTTENLNPNISTVNHSPEEFADFKQLLQSVLTDIFLGKVCEIEINNENPKQGNFIQPVVRKIQRIIKLHT